MSIFQEFKSFAMKGNMVDLAVGVIIGAALSKVVDSMVKNLLMPPLGWLIGGVSMADLAIKLPGTGGKTVDIGYGMLLQAMIEFAIICLMLFLMLRLVKRLRGAPKAEPGTTAGAPVSEAYLKDIRDALVGKR